MKSRATQAIVAFRRLNDEQLQMLYSTVAGYQRDLRDDSEDTHHADTLLELMEALEEEGLLEPPGEDTPLICTECKRQMLPEECGDEDASERVCDACAGIAE